MKADGLKVIYNGRKNTVITNSGICIDYEIGELLLELYEANELLFADLIPECWGRDNDISDAIVENTFDNLFEDINKFVPYAFVVMAKSSFVGSYYVYKQAKEKGIYSASDVKTMGELLDVCLEEFLSELDDFKQYFYSVVAWLNDDCSAGDKERIDSFFTVFSKNREIQDISYEIISDTNKQEMCSVFSICNLFSLLSFEYCHMRENGSIIKICKNCGRFFLPENRSDTLYCSNASPQDEYRTCKQIGAQIAMQNRLKEDECMHAYRKKYQSINMAYQRASDEEKAFYLNKRNLFKNFGKKKKQKLEEGEITSEEYVTWCKQYK